MIWASLWPLPKKKKILKKEYKIDHISKTKNRTKKSCMQKMSVRWILIYPANLATFEESWIFRRAKRLFWTPVAPKCDMKFTPITFFYAHLDGSSQMATSERGVVCISVVAYQNIISKINANKVSRETIVLDFSLINTLWTHGFIKEFEKIVSRWAIIMVTHGFENWTVYRRPTYLQWKKNAS